MRDFEDKTALHSAAIHGNVECIQLLLEDGTPVDIEDSVGNVTIYYF